MFKGPVQLDAHPIRLLLVLSQTKISANIISHTHMHTHNTHTTYTTHTQHTHHTYTTYTYTVATKDFLNQHDVR